jgi:hypothetical protein
VSAELEQLRRRIVELRAVEMQRGLRRIGIDFDLDVLLPLDHPRKRRETAAIAAGDSPRVLVRCYGERVHVVR